MMRVLAIIVLLGVSRVHADPISVQDYQTALKALVEQAEEPIGLLANAKSPLLGLEKGDLVTAINGEAALAAYTFGSLTDIRAIQALTVMRGKKELSVSVHLKPVDQTVHLDRDRFFDAFGASAKRLTSGSAYLTVMKNGVPAGTFVRLSFSTEYPAQGDIIRRIDGKAVTTGAEVDAAFEAQHDKAQFAVDLERLGQPFKVTFFIDSPDPAITAGIAAIKKINDTTYEVPRTLVDALLANPMVAAKGARVVPAVKDGKPHGFKLYAIRPGSIFAVMGLMNGDTLTSVNDLELTSADKALDAYTKLRDTKQLKIAVTRKGAQLTFTYTIK